jgi:hypothetical protein
VRYLRTLALAFFLAAALAGCGGGSSSEESRHRTAGDSASRASAADTSSHQKPRISKASGKRSQDADRKGGRKPAGRVEKPRENQNGGADWKVVQKAIEQVERLQRRAAQPLSPEELERIVERRASQTGRLLDPPPGKSVADVIREIERESAEGVP